MRRLCLLVLPLVFVAAALGQKAAGASCENPTYPVNNVTNRPPVPPSNWIAPQSAVVGVDLTIDATGHVAAAVVVYSGGKGADEAVLKTGRHWTYTPAMYGTTPVATRIHVKINLQLGKHS
jgi:TonB family protein